MEKNPFNFSDAEFHSKYFGLAWTWITSYSVGKFFHKKSVSTLVRESIANPCMDYQKSTDINMDIHDFWMSVFNYPYKRGYPRTDIHTRTFRNGYP